MRKPWIQRHSTSIFMSAVTTTATGLPMSGN
jgi:hypothetical protein